MAKKKVNPAPSMTPEKIKRVQELRRSGATRYTETTPRREQKRRAIEEDSS